MALTNNGWSLIALPLLANRCKGGISERRKARTFLFSSSLSLYVCFLVRFSRWPLSLFQWSWLLSQLLLLVLHGHIFEDGGRIVMQIGRPQISFYLILRMANLGSKAREKGQNYKDLGLLPLSLTSNEAPHVKLRRAKRHGHQAAKRARAHHEHQAIGV